MFGCVGWTLPKGAQKFFKSVRIGFPTSLAAQEDRIISLSHLVWLGLTLGPLW